MKNMADMSLDDYMGKKNFKVQFQNNKLKVNTKAFQKKFPTGNRFKGRDQKTNVGLQIKKFQKKTAQHHLRKTLPTKTFDVRQKLVQAKSATAGCDARQKIILSQKKKGTFDARCKIKKPLVQSPSLPKQKILVTGLDKIKTDGTVQIGGSGGLRKILQNEFANGGSQVTMFGNSIQITRSVPNSQVSFDGNDKLTITKRASAIKLSQPVKRAPSPIKWSDELTGPSPAKKATMIKTYKAGNTIPISDNYTASARLRKRPPATANKAICVATKPKEEILTPKPPNRQAPHSSNLVVKTKSVYRPVKVKQEADEYNSIAGIDIDHEEDVLSPLQGFKVSVTNLDPRVSQDDLIELFGSIGALKRARVSRPGLGEVVYVKKEDAQKAMSKYHNRELDGLPMQVKVVTPQSAKIQSLPHDYDDVSFVSIPDSLKLFKSPALASSTVEVPLIHRALFKSGPQTSATPVTFTVKL